MSRHRINCSYNKIPITPPGNSQDNFQLICGCNGMLLKKRIASNNFLIMNSATRQMLELPDPHKNSFGMTFSFVPSTACYKLVSIYDDNDETRNEGCEILTIGSDNSWSTINFPSLNDANKKREKIVVVSAGEAVHCTKINNVRTCFCAEMVSLDLESESFKSTIMPKGLFSNWEKVWAIDWNGCLPFAVRVEEFVNVVVLEDYKKLKWAKEKIVIPLAFTNSTPNLMEDLVPLFAQNGDLWLTILKCEN